MDRARYRCGVSVLNAQGGLQWPEMLIIMFPASNGFRMQWLAHLIVACGVYEAFLLVKAQAGRIPLQPAEFDQLRNHLVRASDDFLVMYVQYGDVEHLPPVRHQPFVFAVVRGGVDQIVGIRMAGIEILEIDREANVERIPHTVDHPRSREETGDQSQVQCAWQALNHLRDVRQLAGAEDLRMTGKNLFDEARSGARHADDEDRPLRDQARARQAAPEGNVEGCYQRVDTAGVYGGVLVGGLGGGGA